MTRLWRALRGAGDGGMTTAEYCVGTVAACAFAAVLLKLMTTSWIVGLVKGAIEHAFKLL